MADINKRNQPCKNRPYKTLQQFIDDGNLSLKLSRDEVESICKGLGIGRFDEVLVRYKGKTYIVYFEISDWDDDELYAWEKNIIDIT